MSADPSHIAKVLAFESDEQLWELILKHDAYDLKDGQKIMAGGLIFVVHGNIFIMRQRRQVFVASTGYAAIGSGEEYAMGSLRTSHKLKEEYKLDYSPTAILRHALEAAEENRGNVRGPFVLLET